MLFLATPHRTAAIRPSLVWGLEHGWWEAESSLEGAVETLDRINEWFSQTDGDGLHIASFFEQPPTGESVIVDEHSSCLEFPREIIRPIRAHHSEVSRYYGQNDPGFTKVAQQLRQISHRLGPFKRQVWSLAAKEKTDLLHSFLRTDGAPYDDLASFYPQHLPGSCMWIESDPQYAVWLKDRAPRPHILYLTGLAGSGKATLGSFVIDRLEKMGLPCQFYFFRHDDESKRSVTSLFRSLASQMADRVELFRDHLVALAAGGYNLDYDNPDSIWKKVFASELSSVVIDDQDPIYWIVTGLDDCDTMNVFLRGLADPSLSTVPFRLLVSGTSPTLPCAEDGSLFITRINLDESNAKREAMRPLIAARLNMHDVSLEDHIIRRARGNYFELDKAIREFGRHGNMQSRQSNYDTMERPDLEQYWKDITSDLYARIGAGNQGNIRCMLTLVAYAKFPLTAEQIYLAILAEGGIAASVRDLVQLCGAIVQVDKQSRLTIKHRTAWNFLTSSQAHVLCQSHIEGHSTFLMLNLEALINSGAGSPYEQSKPSPWLEYAITSWAYHLHRSAAYQDGKLLSRLGEFLNGPGVIWWIYMLARSDQLSLLADTSAALLALCRRRGGKSTTNVSDSLLIPWATELTRILGKFGTQLRRHPSAIYEVIPAFCPRSSLVRQRLEGNVSSSRVVVDGVLDEIWDDTLARIPVTRPSKVICTSQHVVVSSVGSDKVKLVSTATPCDSRMLQHEGIVHCMRFSNSGHMLALASTQTIAVWQVDIWLRRWSFAIPPNLPVLDLAFDQSDMAVLACFTDGSVWRYPLDDLTTGSRRLGSALATDVDGDQYAPSLAAFSQDATLLAVAYYGMPLSVWGVDVDAVESGLRGLYSAETTCLDGTGGPVRQVTWTPAPYQILAVCGGSAYMWDPSRQLTRRVTFGGTTNIHSSPTGSFILTVHNDGGFTIWDSTDLSSCYISPRYASLATCALCPRGHTLYRLSTNSCDVQSLGPLIDLHLDREEHREVVDVELSPKLTETSIPERSAPTEVLAVSPCGDMYFTAHAQGKLRICSTSGSELFAHDSAFSITIVRAAWSTNGKLLAFTDDLNRLHVQKMPPKRSQWDTGLQLSLAESPSQIIFHMMEDTLVLASAQSLYSWSFQPPRSSTEMNLAKPYLWQNHPLRSDLLLGFCHDSVYVVHWKTLTPIAEIPLCLGKCTCSATTRNIASESRSCQPVSIYPSINGSMIVVVTQSSQPGGIPSLFFVRTVEIDAACNTTGQHVFATGYPREVLDRIIWPLGFVQPLDKGANEDGGFAFLDKSGSFNAFDGDRCIYEYCSFLPGSWIDPVYLSLAHLLSDGTLYLPKGDGVAVITHGFEKVLADHHI